jgi:hypothetical protein
MRASHLQRFLKGKNIGALLITAIATVILFGGQAARAQVFSSGSNGSDGALDFSNVAAGTTVDFNPAAFNPQLDPDGDNVYHFTTINIPAGVTVRLSARYLKGPVYWLATGAVQINGSLSLDGGVGHPGTSVPAVRIPSVPGPGGFGGGIGGHISSTRPAPAQSGNGPAGGGTRTGCCELYGHGGGFSGNRYLVPLVGGSGGGGANYSGPDNWGSGGGAGGGAILIASSMTIVVNGALTAEGGDGGNFNTCCSEAGAGAGGAIRLVAGTIGGNGRIAAVRGRTGGRSGASQGFIRLEAFRHEFKGTFGGTKTGESTPSAFASPSTLFLPATAAPSVRAVSVAGVAVPALPNGSFEVPDVVISAGGAATVAIEARFVPPGTVVKVHLFTENVGDQIVDSTPLQGTLELSTATASVVIPSGFSRGFVRAVWR